MNLRQTLYAWRDNEASKRAVELFRILPNTALDEIVRSLPRTKEELTAIKGIKDAKWREFGKNILAMVDEHVTYSVNQRDKAPDRMESIASLEGVARADVEKVEKESTFSVSAYLDIINNALWRLSARVEGEITSVKMQGSAVYMNMKDKKDDSLMSIFMWASDYETCGVEVTEGLEVIVDGKSDIYKPNGRFSFRAQTIELVGEGALKRSYDLLKKKLELEGLFTVKKKRALPEFPANIGLITSKQGAVIHDFLNNLGKFGYKVGFTDARVEGVAAVKELLAAMKYFRGKEIEVLVIIRGGGSLESLQAFNNELIVRAIAEFPVPVICAIGHDKDVPLAQLAADFAPSTPTAATALLNAPWQELEGELSLAERTLTSSMSEVLWSERSAIISMEASLLSSFADLYSIFRSAEESFRTYIPVFEQALENIKRESVKDLRAFTARFHSQLASLNDLVKKLATELEILNPLRQLKLGYSILSQDKKILRSILGKGIGEHFEARLSDGTLLAEIKKINPI